MSIGAAVKAFDVNLEGFEAAIRSVGRHCRDDVLMCC